MSQTAHTHPLAGLHVLADDDPRWGRSPVEIAEAACRGGARVVQLRAKHLGDREALDQARAIRACTRSAGVCFVVNDRFDLALLAEADGVHLGQDDLPPDALPEAVRAALQVGRSTHDEGQWKRACEEPVDYVAFGPVYGTASKDSPYDARGLEAVRAAARAAAPRPLIAIGGIDLARIGDVARAGAAGVAVISAVTAADDMVEATRSLVAAFDAAARESARG